MRRLPSRCLTALKGWTRRTTLASWDPGRSWNVISSYSCIPGRSWNVLDQFLIHSLPGQWAYLILPGLQYTSHQPLVPASVRCVQINQTHQMEILFQRITRQFLNRKAFPQILRVILCPLPNQSKVKYIQKQCLDPVTSIYDYSLLNYEAQNYTAGMEEFKNDRT